MENDVSKMIRLSGICYESLVNGAGGYFRRVYFVQGCRHNCKGCFNPDTHDFNGGEYFNVDDLLDELFKCSYIKGVTFSGGDPLEQPCPLAYMAKKIKEHGLNLWSYTGYTWEYIMEHIEDIPYWKELISRLDVLVDGRFVQELHEENLKFRGSSNQRLIDVQESLKQGKVILFKV